MIKIFKDKDVKVVTKGAFESFYKPLGYDKLDDEKSIKEDKKVETKKSDEIKKDEVKVETVKKSYSSSKRK